MAMSRKFFDDGSGTGESFVDYLDFDERDQFAGIRKFIDEHSDGDLQTGVEVICSVLSTYF